MANQLKMAEVQAILALTRSGWSDRHIARQLGVHRETVGRHRRLSRVGEGGGQSPTPASRSQDNSKPASAPTGSTALAAGGSEGAPTGSIGTTCSTEGLANSTEGVVVHSKPASAPIGSTGLAAGGFISTAEACGGKACRWREIILQKLESGLTA